MTNVSRSTAAKVEGRYNFRAEVKLSLLRRGAVGWRASKKVEEP